MKNGRAVVATLLSAAAITVTAYYIGKSDGVPMTWEQAATIGAFGAIAASLASSLVGL